MQHRIFQPASPAALAARVSRHPGQNHGLGSAAEMRPLPLAWLAFHPCVARKDGKRIADIRIIQYPYLFKYQYGYLYPYSNLMW